MKYTITRGKNDAWPTREYTLSDIQARAAKDRRTVRDGYGRSRIREARKLMALDTRGKRAPVVFQAVDEPDEPPKPFGPK